VRGDTLARVARLDPVDVVVIGAGLGAAAFCARLSERAPRLRIVCLERGDWVDRSAMPAYRTDWQRAALAEWATSPNVRLAAEQGSASADYPIDDSASPIKPLMWNGVGGSTINWAAHLPRLHPSDFRTRTLDGVGNDWPFTYFDLEPYYDLNDSAMGVAGVAGDPAYPPKRSPRLPPLAVGRLGEVAARGFNALGWHWWPADAAITTVDRDGRHACNNAGPCLTGCPIGAKASADLVYWPAALQRGVQLRTRCVAQQVIVHGGRAIGVAYRDGTGATHEQPARFTVVAGNGIGTARLLLASRIGEESAALGRYLMFHPIAYARGMFTEELDGPRGPIGSCIYSHEFYETGPGRESIRRLQLQVTRENAPLQQAVRLEPNWGRSAHALLRDEFRHSLPVMVVAEDLPEARNRVALTDEVAPDGLPGVRIEYTLSDDARRTLDFGLDRAEEMLRAAGAHRVVRVPLAPLTGWHLLGTARMGTDPKTSVTDGRGRCHAVPNLLVADGSLFPTVGAVNPGATIAAVALKLADDLAAEVA
jgi:choline dehydrogenase-like flavoprotein